MSCPKSISARVYHVRRQAEGLDRDQLSQQRRSCLKTLHLLFENFAQAWHNLAATDYGQDDSYHNDYWPKLDAQTKQKAAAAAFKILYRQLRSEYSQTLTDVIHVSVSRSVTAESHPLALLFSRSHCFLTL